MDTIEKIEALKKRTKQMALRVIKMTQKLPKTDEARVIGKQILRSATSVAANYRAVARNRSDAERISKLSIVTEEADETLFWLELLVEAEIVPITKLSDLMAECEEILKMTSKSLSNLKEKANKKRE
ncbi:MAG: four helix bundle protein [Saprospiraceae bacterium]|jgi:four helix bundle protein|nr:four helix bundle protein [Saprospiraceae bacterium]